MAIDIAFNISKIVGGKETKKLKVRITGKKCEKRNY